jgi:fumarylacetoacetase
MNATHDPERRSWVTSANRPGSAFPIQNLPFGVFASGAQPAIGVAIGDQILDLHGCYRAGLFASLPETTAEACAAATLNPLMALGSKCWSPLRAQLSDLLRADHPQAADNQRDLAPFLLSMLEMTMLKPASIGNYTDFYASIDHATNVGRLFRPENPLLPNYKYVPIGYHGRASSICVSGTPVKRPAGQFLPLPGGAPRFALTQALDYELEVGFFVGPGNQLGEAIDIDQAAAHLFGICLLNDWSARDIQSWEYQPLGPFLAKSFATTISPWIVTMEALAPFRTPAFARPKIQALWTTSTRSRIVCRVELTLPLRSTSVRPVCARWVWMPFASAAETSAPCTGPRRNYWPIMQATGAIFNLVICWPAAPSPDPRIVLADACSKLRGAVSSRLLCPQGSYVGFSKTATRSRCADIASGKAL